MSYKLIVFAVLFTGLSFTVITSSLKAQTIAHKILELESEVIDNKPDYLELDNILVKIINDVKNSEALNITDEEEKAKSVFLSIAQTLKNNSYYHNNTYPNTLTEVLNSEGDKHFDCDTGSFIFIAAGDKMNLPISMVEIEVAGNPGEREFGDHNFVRWTLQNGQHVDWDPNAERLRYGDKKTNLYGFAWTDDQLFGYLYFTRGISWRENDNFENAINDYYHSIKKFPSWAKARNNLAWLYSTVKQVQSDKSKIEALELALDVVDLHPVASNKDTLACAYAINSNFTKAAEIQTEVVNEDNSAAYKVRLEKFRNNQNCLGEE